MSVDLISLNNDFFIEPVKSISKVLILKNTPGYFFQNIFDVIFNYLKDYKENRTIEDVKEAFDVATKKLSLDNFEDMNPKKIETEINNLRNSASHFIQDNAQKIEETFYETKAKAFLLRWIFAYDEAMQIFLQFGEKANMRRYLIRRPKDVMFFYYRLFEGLFLVLYRIIEQIYMLANNLPIDEKKEKEYLIGDIVYYDNLQRSLLHDTFHGK